MSIDSGNHRHSPESNNPSRSSSSSYNCVSLTLVLAFVLLVFFILGFFTIYIFRYLMQLLHHAALSRSRNHARIAVGHDNQTSRPSFHGLYPDIIASFPTFCFSSEKDLPPGLNSLECSVCLAEFSEGELLRQLLHGCSHVFHRECIDIWFVDHNTCPVCRLELNSVVKSSLGGTPLLLRNLGEINSRDQQTEHVVLVVEVAGRPPSQENRAAERAAEEGHEDERRTCIMHENGPEVHT